MGWRRCGSILQIISTAPPIDQTKIANNTTIEVQTEYLGQQGRRLNRPSYLTLPEPFPLGPFSNYIPTA